MFRVVHDADLALPQGFGAHFAEAAKLGNAQQLEGMMRHSGFAPMNDGQKQDIFSRAAYFAATNDRVAALHTLISYAKNHEPEGQNLAFDWQWYGTQNILGAAIGKLAEGAVNIMISHEVNAGVIISKDDQERGYRTVTFLDTLYDAAADAVTRDDQNTARDIAGLLLDAGVNPDHRSGENLSVIGRAHQNSRNPISAVLADWNSEHPLMLGRRQNLPAPHRRDPETVLAIFTGKAPEPSA